MTKRVNEGSTHWEGCETEHHECALARMDEALAKLAACKREVEAFHSWYDGAHQDELNMLWAGGDEWGTWQNIRAENEQREREGK